MSTEVVTADDLDPRLARALERVVDPCSCTAGVATSILDMGLVLRAEVLADGGVEVVMGVTGPGCTYVGILTDAAEREARAEFGPDTDVRVEVDTAFVWTEDRLSPAGREALAARRRRTVLELGLRPRMWEEAVR